MINLILENEFDELRRAFLDEAKYVCICAGRRSGKTFEAFDWLYRELLFKGAKNALWVDTKHSNIDKYVERYCKPRLEPIWYQCSYNAQKKILTFPNNTYIDFGSAERPENLEGFEYERIIVNEAGIALRKKGLWENTIRPMAKGNNKTRIIGTPKGKNKFHELFVRGRSGDEDWHSMKLSAYDSPYWDEEELEDIKKSTPEHVFKQEYMAEFIEGGGTIFRNVSDRVSHETHDTAQSGTEYVMGVDLAKHQDFTVIMIADRTKKHVVFMDRFNQIDWGFQKKRIIGAWEKFNKPRLIIDSTGVGDAIYDDLRSTGMGIEGFKFTNSSKNDLITNLAVAIDNGDITYPQFDILLDELSLYEYTSNPRSGTFSYNAPEGFHDDTVIALALVNNLINTRKTAKITFI